MSLANRGVPFIGTVANFDDATGWGVVATEDEATYPFHCTAIAGGTRTIEADTLVSFWLVPGHRGQWEAAGVISQRPRQ